MPEYNQIGGKTFVFFKGESCLNWKTRGQSVPRAT